MDYFVSIGVHNPMNTGFYTIHTIWLLMMILTLTSYFVSEQGYSGIWAVFFLLLTAIIKGYFIISDFMELKGVSLLWRAIMYGWLLTVCFTIAICYILGV